jgi:hypothetical protein
MLYDVGDEIGAERVTLHQGSWRKSGTPPVRRAGGLVSRNRRLAFHLVSSSTEAHRFEVGNARRRQAFCSDAPRGSK